VALARQTYDSRDCGAILADAVQEADCDSGDIFSHSRSAGVHVSVRWVVDPAPGEEP
jgi:hypothetical protein